VPSEGTGPRAAPSPGSWGAPSESSRASYAPPAPSWGAILDEGRNYLTTGWWLALFPGLAIPGVVLGINVVGDWLRDTLDPRVERGTG
jgi:hypothetical protein